MSTKNKYPFSTFPVFCIEITDKIINKSTKVVMIFKSCAAHISILPPLPIHRSNVFHLQNPLHIHSHDSRKLNLRHSRHTNYNFHNFSFFTPTFLIFDNWNHGIRIHAFCVLWDCTQRAPYTISNNIT